MKLNDFLLANKVPIDLTSYKVHLATTSDSDPLQAYFEGTFKDWQEWQTKRNFGCQHVIGLIALPERNRWLFAGVYQINGEPVQDTIWHYSTTLVPESQPWVGRLIIDHARSSRASYLWGTAEPFDLVGMLEEPMSIEEFPGYNWVCVPYAKLKTIVTKEVPSWRTALKNVKGIYLITDTLCGKKYVGKADGESGLWQRWNTYIWTGHGGNRDLIALLGNNPPEYLENFQFSILEIADSHASDEYINERETHWKNVLCSRGEHGYNAN